VAVVDRDTPYFVKEPDDEEFALVFDFSDLVETLLFADVTVSWHSGSADPAPQGILGHTPSIEGARVFQKVTGGRNGSVYLLRCSATASTKETYVDKIRLLVMDSR
jgi:hypothetical protein